MSTTMARSTTVNKRLYWIMLVVATLVISFIPATKAEAATLSKGNGYKVVLGGVTYWLGYYSSTNANGVALWCPDPYKSPTAPVSSAVTTVVGGSDATRIAKLNFVLHNYGVLSNVGGPKRYDEDHNAAVRLSTLTYTGHKALADKLKYKVPARAQSLFKTMISGAEAYAGPYKMSATLNGKPTLGKSSTVSIKVVATRTGKAVPNVVVVVSAANAKLSATTVSTGSTGIAKVTFTKTAWADVKITASTKNTMASTSIRLWKPPYTTYQRFLSAAPGVKLSSSATYRVTPTNLGLSYVCNSDCNGVAPVTFTNAVCNTYGGTARFVMLDNGVARSDFLTLAPGACGNKVWQMADTHSAQIRLDVYTNGKWVSTTLPNKIVVDCPPWPQLAFNGGFDCVKGNLNLTVPAGPHAQRIIVNGAVTEKAANQAITVSTAFTCDKANSYTVATAVQRTNGAWNTSPAATFAFPATT